jgi:hypothetical protein
MRSPGRGFSSRERKSGITERMLAGLRIIPAAVGLAARGRKVRAGRHAANTASIAATDAVMLLTIGARAYRRAVLAGIDPNDRWARSLA